MLERAPIGPPTLLSIAAQLQKPCRLHCSHAAPISSLMAAPQVLHLPPVFDLQRQLRPKAAPRDGGGPQPPPNSAHVLPTPASLRAASPGPRLQRMSAPASLQQDAPPGADPEADPEQGLGAGSEQAPDALDAARRLAAESLHPSLMHALSEPPGGPGAVYTRIFWCCVQDKKSRSCT